VDSQECEEGGGMEEGSSFSTVTCFVPRRLFSAVRSGASGSYVPSLFRDDHD
jgi:hypothetical protein